MIRLQLPLSGLGQSGSFYLITTLGDVFNSLPLNAAISNFKFGDFYFLIWKRQLCMMGGYTIQGQYRRRFRIKKQKSLPVRVEVLRKPP